MKETLLQIRDGLEGFLYRHLVKKVFFLFDPEDVHDRMTNVGVLLGKFALTRKITGLLFGYEHPALRQRICGVDFPNPVGLAAGFDKNVQLPAILPSVGFGFMEGGSITGEACEGNPRPRLWRLKKTGSLVVYYGLKNDGVQSIAQKLQGKKFAFPLGISVAKTNSPQTVTKEEGIADYLKGYALMKDAADYITINISCPNAYGGCPFTNPQYLEQLLKEVAALGMDKPVFIKLSPDLSEQELDEIIGIARKYQISGFVSTNLTKNRNNPHLKETQLPAQGGISGKALTALADEQVSRLYAKVGQEFVIIGCGGIFSAQDAYRKIRQGASLVQLITGMIFEGPQLIGEINRELVRLLRADGFTSIGEAVGADFKQQGEK